MDELPTEKQCSKCLVFKPMEEFYRDKSAKDNKTPKCKECMKKYSKAHYKKNPQKKHKATTIWRRKNPERAKELRDKWIRENPEKARECVRESIRRMRAANPEKFREIQRNKRRKREAANPEKFREKKRKYADRKRATTAQQAIFKSKDPDTLVRITNRLAKLEQKQTHE